MRKALLLIAAVIVAALAVTGCTAPATIPNAVEVQKPERMFYSIGTAPGPAIIVVCRSNGVMYAVSTGANNGGTYTVLLDDDGKPMIWGKDEY